MSLVPRNLALLLQCPISRNSTDVPMSYASKCVVSHWTAQPPEEYVARFSKLQTYLYMNCAFACVVSHWAAHNIRLSFEKRGLCRVGSVGDVGCA